MIRVHSFHVVHRNGWGSGIGPAPTHCADCGGEIVREPGSISTGYASEPGGESMDASTFSVLTGEPLPALKPGETIQRSRSICFDCCGRQDVAAMIRTGRASLYVTQLDNADVVPRAYGSRAYRVTNWPSTLEISAVGKTSKRGGGFGCQRTDVWFTGPDGKQWHGINRGYSQILQCRRLKGAA